MPSCIFIFYNRLADNHVIMTSFRKAVCRCRKTVNSKEQYNLALLKTVKTFNYYIFQTIMLRQH